LRILLTNDDGINAPGLAVLEDIVAAFDPGAEVWVVAPAFEQSGVGHCISYSRPMAIAKLGDRRFAAEGFPADCVLAAIYDVFDGAKPDLILSGVNRGNNAAENVMYSGTVGAAMEGALQGIPSVAFSQYYAPVLDSLDDPWEAGRVHGAAALRALWDKAPWDGGDYRLFYNVNFPPVARGNVKGIKVAAQGFRQASRFSTETVHSPHGRRFLWVKGGPQHTPTAPGTDAAACLDGWISVTPLTCDLTAHARLAEITQALS
jgi:5'-nucleotidase